MAKTKKENVEETTVKKSNYGYTPCDFIFEYVEKPTDYIFSKCFNVFDDKWRVNLYSKRYVEGIEGKYISNSYFVKFNSDNNKLVFVSP
jgi:hypothetical protein